MLIRQSQITQIVVTASTENFTALENHSVILIDTTSNAVTINLPAASGNSGLMYNIKALNIANVPTVDANSSETIDGSLTYEFTEANESITIVCNGSDWYIISKNEIELTSTGIPTYISYTAAESATGVSNDICYVVDTETFYRYESNGSSYTVDHLTILSTGDSGNTRWLGISGKYSLPNNISDVTHEPMGIPVEDLSKFTISYDYSTRILTLTYVSNWNVFVKGKKFLKTASIIMDAHTNAYGVYYYYFDDTGTLICSDSTWSFSDNAPVAMVMFNPSATSSIKGFVLDERHGIVMDWATHQYEHTIAGTQYISGFAIGGYTLSIDSVSATTYSYTEGVMADEDLRVTVAALADGGPYTLFFKNGASGNWDWITGSATPYNIVSNNIVYNQYTGGAWQLTQISTNDRYINHYPLATQAVSSTFKHIIVIGQEIYATLALARAEDFRTVLSRGTLPIPEYCPLNQVISVYKSSYSTSTGKSAIAEVNNLRGAITVTGVTASSNHLNLSNLSGGVYLDGGHINMTVAKISSSMAPGINDDITNYKEAAVWIKEDTDQIYICVDNTDGAAKWAQINSIVSTQTSIYTGFESGLSAISTGSSFYGYQSGFRLGTINYNTGFGYQAMYGNVGGITGVGNIALGPYTLYSISSGTYNMVQGYESGYGITTGSYNTAIGYRSLYTTSDKNYSVAIGYRCLYNANNNNNLAIGYEASFNLTSATYTIAIGTSAGYTITDQNFGIFIGYQAGYYVIGASNTGIGYGALYGATGGASTGTDNVAVGVSAMNVFTSAYSCVAIGGSALRNVTSGYANTAIGAGTLYTVSTTGANTAIGYYAAEKITTTGIVAIGQYALRYGAGGNYNIGIGYEAGRGVDTQSTGIGNIAIGYQSLVGYTSGIYSIAIGYQALYTISTTGYCTAIGALSLYNNTANYCVAIGHAAGNKTVSYEGQTFIGYNAGRYTTGDGNLAIGYQALLGVDTITNGIGNLAIGYQALIAATTAASCIALGYKAGTAITSGASILSIGYEALTSITTASYAAGMGYRAGKFATGAYNLFIGTNAGLGVSGQSSGTENIGIGHSSLVAFTSGAYNIAIGLEALYSITTNSYALAIGYRAGKYATGANNLFIGYNSGLGVSGQSSGGLNFAIGYLALTAFTTGTDNYALGEGALSSVTTGTVNYAIGYYALSSVTTVNNLMAIGYRAGRYNTGVGNLFIGANCALGVSGQSSGTYNLAIGNSALQNYTTADYSIAIGYTALYNVTTGDFNTAIGYEAGYSMITGGYLTAIGYQAGKYVTGEINVFIGANAGLGVSGQSTAYYNIAIGLNSQYAITTGYENVSIGHDALRCCTTGYRNTAIGYLSGNIQTTATDCTFIGYQAGRYSQRAQMMAIGNSSYIGVAPVLEVTSITVNGSTKSNYLGDYFIICSGYIGDDTTPGRGFWFDTTGSDTMPVFTADNKIKINISACSTTTDIAIAIETAIDTDTGWFTATSSTNIVTVTHSVGRESSKYTNACSEITISVTTRGMGTYPSTLDVGNNVAIGVNCLTLATRATTNVAMGITSMYSLKWGRGNTSIGNQALRYCVFGSNNTAIGSASLGGQINASDNVGIGLSAGSNVSHNENTAIGTTALAGGGTYTSEVTSITVNSATLANYVGDYFFFYNGLNINYGGYASLAFWFDTTGSDSKPGGAVGTYTIPINISACTTTNHIATAINNAVNEYVWTNAGFYLTSTVLNNVVTVTHRSKMYVTHAVGTYASEISIAVTTYGSGNNSAYSTAIGYQALRYNTMGAYNVAIGHNAMLYNATGQYGVAIGVNALEWNLFGNYNTAIGNGAISESATYSNNVGIGYYAGRYLCYPYNVAIGSEALTGIVGAKEITSIVVNSATLANYVGDYFTIYNGVVGVTFKMSLTFWFDTTGSDSQPGGAIGDIVTKINITGLTTTTQIATAISNAISEIYNYAYTNTSGMYLSSTSTTNTVTVTHRNRIGNTTPANNCSEITITVTTTGSGNNAYYTVAVGYQALYFNSTGVQNTAIGMQVLYNNSTGINNTGIGQQALFYFTTASYNVGIGAGAMVGQSGLSTGSYNIGIGYRAGYIITTGTNNLLLGYQAGDTLTSGSDNIVIGSDADVSATVSNSIVIGKNSSTSVSNQIYVGNASIASAIVMAPITILESGTIESWNTDYTVLQIGNTSSIFGHTAAGAGKSLYVSQNAYYDTGSLWKYQDTDEASLYKQDSGIHKFYTAGWVEYETTTVTFDFTYEMGLLNNKYFWIFTSTKSYYVWMNEGGEGSDPNPSVPSGAPSTKQGVQVAIDSDWTNATAAEDVSIVIHALSDFNSVYDSFYSFTITNVTAEVVKDAINGNMPTGLSIEKIKDGNNVGTADNEVIWGERFTIDIDGSICTNATVYSDVINTRALYIDSSGNIGTTSSTIRHKTNVTDLEDISFIYKLLPKTYEYKKRKVDSNGKLLKDSFGNPIYLNEGDGIERMGFIAEDAELSKKSLIYYDKEGKPSGIKYDDIIPGLVKVVQLQKEKIEYLENKLSNLEV